jgi:hypothetical protein
LWAILEVADLRFNNPQLKLMTAVKQVVTPEKCRLHGHPVTDHDGRVRYVYELCKERDEFGRYGLTNPRLDRNGRTQRKELYDHTRHSDAPIGTEKRVVYGSPACTHAFRQGWQIVKQWPDGTYTIRRDFQRLLTQEQDEQKAIE